MIGVAARMQSSVPITFTSKIRRISSGDVAATGRKNPYPALHTSVSILPKRSFALAISVSQSSIRPTSLARHKCPREACIEFLQPIDAPRRQRQQRPRRASSMASALPIPALAPVMITTMLRRLRIARP